jgi:lysophospholipase L1-like esterase
MLAEKYPVTFSLFAVSGQTSTQLLRRWPTYQKAVSRANLITWNIGGNDIRLTWRIFSKRPMPKAVLQKRMSQTLTTLQANWDILASQLRRTAPPGAKIVAINIYNPYRQNQPGTATFVAIANQALAEICAKHHIILIDAHSLFHHAKYFSQDQLHLNQPGYALLAKTINQTLHPNLFIRLKYLLNRKVW